MDKQKVGERMANYGEYGYIDFSKLWVELARQKKTKQFLRDNNIHSNTIAKLVKNENVTTEVITKLCYILNCQPSRIMEYKRKPKERDT